MHEDERDVGKARSALGCISLIYYLADFQALILSTLEEVSPPPHLPPTRPPPLPHVTSWLAEGLFLWATMFPEIPYREEASFSEANAEKWQIAQREVTNIFLYCSSHFFLFFFPYITFTVIKFYLFISVSSFYSGKSSSSFKF